MEDTGPPPPATQLWFDWDDTLFPSTELIHGSLQPVAIHDLETLVLTILQNVVTSGTKQVAIVTNSRPGWVETSSAQFAPRLSAFLHGHRTTVPVLYAREYAQPHELVPSSVPSSAAVLGSAEYVEAEATALHGHVWKLRAFQDLADRYRQQRQGLEPAERQEVYIIGDSAAEKWAAEVFAALDPTFDVVTFVKLLPTPTSALLFEQLQTLGEHTFDDDDDCAEVEGFREFATILSSPSPRGVGIVSISAVNTIDAGALAAVAERGS